jgi:transposase
MPSAYSAHLGWLVVVKRVLLGHSWQYVSEALHVSKHYQADTLRRYFTTGDVVSSPAPRARRLTARMRRALVHDILDSPTRTLDQRKLTLQLDHGVVVSVPTLCRALREMRLSYGKLQHYALRRDHQKAEAFWTEIATYHCFDDILVGDETAKMLGDMRRTHGWGPMGLTTFERDGARPTIELGTFEGRAAALL